MTAGLMALCYDSFSDVTRRGQGQKIPVSQERGWLLITSETRPDKKMEKRMVITMSSLATLAIIAAIQKSGVMFVSVGVIGAVVYVFRRARMRDRVIAIVAAALGGSIGAEIVHTLYQHIGAVESGVGRESGSLFMSAILLGLINAAAVVVVMFVTEAWLNYAGRKSH
jgi:hypothetical protein